MMTKTNAAPIAPAPVTKSPDEVAAFLTDLAALTAKHGIEIGGCGCCDSPYLVFHELHELPPTLAYTVQVEANGECGRLSMTRGVA